MEARIRLSEAPQAFLQELLRLVQHLQERLAQASAANETSSQALPAATRQLQVADPGWIASLLEVQSAFPGKLLILEARHAHPVWERVVQLRQADPLLQIPLLVVLPTDDPQEITRAYQLGADACLVRPVQPAQLLGVALYLLRKSQRQAA
jgi:response regulator RpfG family c-di-GMP phosphodiesterase